MPAAAGLLLDRTWRMHPDLCRYTSAAFYDGKLGGVDGLGRQEIAGWGSGLRLVEVPHQGNTNASPEEAREVARLAEQLTGRRWRDKDGAERSMEPADILIVTPYNAQIRAIQRALAASGQTGFRVGTVDKFQGQEAPAVIYSMATSSADEAPRGLDFLYDPHRLNVATSRARALAIIVASPDLIRVSCRTPHQMVLANALCQAWETGGEPAGKRHASELVLALGAGDRVLMSCISACGTCLYCRAGHAGQCLGGGGWILGHKIDGARPNTSGVPFADTSTCPLPPGRPTERHT